MADLWAEFDAGAKPRAEGDLWAEFDAPAAVPVPAPEPRAAVPNAPVPAELGVPAAPVPEPLGLGEATLESAKAGLTRWLAGSVQGITESVQAPFKALEGTALGELVAPTIAAPQPLVDASIDAQDLAAQQSLLGRQGAIAPESVGEFIEMAQADPEGAARLLLSIGAESAPGILGAMATRNPRGAMGMVGSSAGGTEYGAARADGAPVQDALRQATAGALMETAGSKATFDEVLGGSSGLGRRLFRAPLLEAAGEGGTGGAQGAAEIVMGDGTAEGASLEAVLGALVGAPSGAVEAVLGRGQTPEAPAPELGTPPPAAGPAPRAPDPAPPEPQPDPELDELLVRNILGDDVAAELGLEEATVAEALASLPELGAEAPPNAAVPAAPDSVPAVAADAPVGTVAPEQEFAERAKREQREYIAQQRADMEAIAAGQLPDSQAVLPPTQRMRAEEATARQAELDEMEARVETDFAPDSERVALGVRAEQARAPQTTAPAVQSSAAPTAPVPAEGALLAPQRAPAAERPLAAKGLTSYRYAGRYGPIMIGAKDNADAIREAGRSTDDAIDPARLEVWDGQRYVPVDSPAPTPAVAAEPAAPAPDALPDILAQPRAAVLKQRIKAAGIKKGSPGYADAVARVEAQLDTDMDAALAETTFEQYRDLNPGVPESVARQAYDALRSEPLASTEEASELDAADLTPAERESLDRQSVDRRAVRQRLSEQQGAADADALGLREAVTKALPGAKVQVTFVRDLDGLPADIARPAQSRMDARGGTRTAGLYVPGPEPRVYVMTGVAKTPEAAAFTAAHEIAGHDGLRKLAGDGLNGALEIALQNPTVAAVAESMTRQRRMGPEARLLAAEEALADLAGAARTGNWSRLEAKHGVKVPLGMRSRVVAAVENFIRRLVALFRKQGVAFSDAQVRDLLESAWQAARGERATAGGAADSAEASALSDDEIFDLLEEYGRTVDNSIDAEKAWTEGDLVFINNEMSDGEPYLAESIQQIRNTVADAMMTVRREDFDRSRAAQPLESVETDFDVREADKLAPPELGLIQRSKREMAERVEAFRKLGKGRPKNPRTLLQRANALRSALFDSVVSRARALERRNPDAKSLRKLFNQVVTAPGESRLVSETMNEQIERTFAQFTNRVRNILANEGFERLTTAQNDQLRAALLGTDKNPAPPIKRAADRLRKLMDVAKDDLIAAGVEIGEVEDIGYLTRLYDDAKILGDEAGFLETAGRYYETEGFANDVGKDARGILYEPGRLAAFIGHAKRVGSPAVREGLDALKAEVRKYRSGGALTEVKAVERIVAELYPAVAKDYGERSAAAWLHKIKTPAVSQVFNGVGPSGSPVTKSRALTGAADTILAPYMNTDVLDILDTYARTTTKKAAMAQRFGPKGEKVQELIDAASREGVPARDLQEATELMESALGSFNPINPDIKAGMDALQAWAYLALLSRVTFSSAAEAMTFAIRTGDIRNAAAPLVQVYRAVTRSQRGKELNDMALLVGLNGNRAMEEVMQNQLGGDYAMEPKWSKLVHNFMQATLLTPLTRAQRAYGVGAATGYLRWLSKNFAAGKRRAEMAALLNELGIADHEAFATWMTAQGALPREADLFDADGRPTPRGLDYMTAVRRMTDQTIQNPNASHRPAWMNNPAGRLAGSIMGFSYAAYENIIKREIALNKTLRTEAPRGTAERRLGAALTGLAALAIGQTLVSTVREMLFNAARFEDKDDDEIAKEMALLGISRTLGLGSADPLIQYLTGLKYRRSAAETMAGAAVGSFAELIDSVVGLATDANSPSTDTAEYRAMEQIYSKVITPVANAALSFLPSYIAAPAILGVSDKRMREKFAGMFFDAPERDTELDRDYRAAVRDLEDVEDAVKARIAIAPKDQWEAELAAIKKEYPVVLDGVTIEKYKVKTPRGAAGTPKVTSDGGPVLGLERSDVDGAGTLLGETEGYRQYNKATRKYEMTPGTEDRIRDLNKTIKALRDGEDLTLGNVADLTAGLMYEADAMPVLMAATADVSRAPGGSFDGAGARVADRATIRDVREELEAIRRAEKRAVLEMTRRAERGEAIPRGFAERYVADAMRKQAP